MYGGRERYEFYMYFCVVKVFFEQALSVSKMWSFNQLPWMEESIAVVIFMHCLLLQKKKRDKAAKKSSITSPLRILRYIYIYY